MPFVAVVGRILKRSFFLFVCLIALTALTAARAHAQEPAQPPAYIAAVDGSAMLERDGETTPAVVNMPLLPGDRLRTAAGRVEIRFPDGTGIEVAEFSAVELLTETRVRLLAGSIDRLDPLQANVGAASTSYLPQDLQMYGSTFDQYGSWRYAPSYGYVWYPMVAAGWRPYHYGYWEPVPRYGWTWIGTDRWAWPTHHYGRWGYAGGAWFWMPARGFAGAWVSWGSAPGYVSWCPLGFDNRPVFGLSAGFGGGHSGWTVVSRTHFGSRGYYAHRYAVDPGSLRHTTFVPHSAPAVAVPRHVGNGVPGGGGFAVPRGDRATRSGAVASRPSPVTASPAVQPAPAVIPPTVSNGRPVRAGTWPSYGRPTSNDQRDQRNQRDQQEQRQPTLEQRPAAQERPTVYERRGTAGYQRPSASEQRSRGDDQRAQRASQPQPAAQPSPTSQPQPRQEAPRAVPRQSAPQQQPAAQQQPAQQNSNGGGHGGGHQRAGTTAQPRAEGGSQGGGGARRR